jgi:hypothetical protein
VVGGGGPVRNEYGRRFEEYCWRYIKAQLPSLPLKREWRYRYRKQQFDTPDVLVEADGKVCVAIECKATKMTARARLGDQADDDRGFNELAKGIYQIWRFFSHSRRGLTGTDVSRDAIGLLLTLDGWLVMGGPLREEAIRRAEALAELDSEITSEDRRPVVFCQVTDLESTLADADEASFVRAIHAAGGPKYEGWLLSNVHSEISSQESATRSRKPYPFDDLAEMLPWWGILEKMRRGLRMQIPG